MMMEVNTSDSLKYLITPILNQRQFWEASSNLFNHKSAFCQWVNDNVSILCILKFFKHLDIN